MLNVPETDSSPERSSSATEGTAALGVRSAVEHLRRDGFHFAAGTGMRRLVEAAGGRDWNRYASSWDDLGPDRFMADGGTYRKRRFGCFVVTGADIRAKPPQPHFQAVAYNALNGGVARTFEPVWDEIASHPVNRALIETCRSLFEAASRAAAPVPAWHVEMHQFRIEGRPDIAGQPTPEGLHRDGVDWVLVLMVRRENVEGGESTIADAERRLICRATLTEPLDASFVDDHRVFHGVSPVRPLDPSRPAFRDVLVLTFRAES